MNREDRPFTLVPQQAVNRPRPARGRRITMDQGMQMFLDQVSQDIFEYVQRQSLENARRQSTRRGAFPIRHERSPSTRRTPAPVQTRARIEPLPVQTQQIAPAPFMSSEPVADDNNVINGVKMRDDEMCITCESRKRSCVFVPCGHTVMCNACSQQYMSGNKKDCPICRQDISFVQRIRD